MLGCTDILYVLYTSIHYVSINVFVLGLKVVQIPVKQLLQQYRAVYELWFLEKNRDAYHILSALYLYCLEDLGTLYETYLM